MEDTNHKSNGSIACILMHFLGQTAKFIHTGLDSLLGPASRDETQPLRTVSQSVVLEKPVSLVQQELSIPSVTVPEITKPSSEPFVPREIPVEFKELFSGIEFESDLDLVNAKLFIEDYRSPVAQIRTKAFQRLQALSKPAALGLLRKLLLVEQNHLQIIKIFRAISTLDTNCRLEIKTFVPFIKHPNSLVRQIAVRIIARYSNDESFSVLSSLSLDKDYQVRKEALNCISWFFRDKGASFIIKSIQDINDEVKKTAIILCGVLRLHQSIPDLIILLCDADLEVQKEAAVALKKITGQDFGFKATESRKSKIDAIEKWSSWWRQNKAIFV